MSKPKPKQKQNTNITEASHR